ncbi:OmpW family protein [Aureimonas sp. AU12]|uniref:OmpW/AlkL family protein n=1 Tax=Aureimonas sp. AU12 TaxID=1638161 RepID=UPI00178CED71|nr:OmpW family outer membrane protein [Aureimonas sp. AU12]
MAIKSVCFAAAMLIQGLALSWSSAQAADQFDQDLAPPMATQGLKAGNWLVRGRIAGLMPVNETSTVGLIGGHINVPDMLLPDLQIAYFLTDHISIEGQAGIIRTRPRIVGSFIGDFDIGSIWSAAGAASVQYHFMPEARFNPYLGAGISYSRPVSIKPDEGITDFSVSAQTSIMIQAGADYQIAGNWFGNAVAKYLFVPEQTYESQSATFVSDSNMVFAGVGIGYRF